MFQLNDTLNKIDAGVIVQGVDNGSALLRAGTAQPAGKGGFYFTQVSGLKGQGLGQGGTKIASGTGVVKKAIPEKFVTSTVYTDETILFASAIYQNVTAASPKANGIAYDRVVLGIDAKPSDFVAFDTFAGVATAEIADLSDFNSVLSSVPTTGIVGTRAFLGYMRSVTKTNGDLAFTVTGGFGKSQDAEVNGVPFYILDKSVSTTSFAIAGDWTSFYTAKVLTNDLVQVKTAGNITDVNGVEHNLTAENKTAVMVENWLASGIGSLSDFVKLTIPA